jgi:hypothetical protein
VTELNLKLKIVIQGVYCEKSKSPSQALVKEFLSAWNLKQNEIIFK